jgi:hypothetical protein
MYVTPEQEIIDLELEAQLLAGSGDDEPQGGEFIPQPVTPIE